MTTKILYHSLSGNTKKIAEEISKELHIVAEAITKETSLTEPIDLLFIGDGIYAGNPNKAVVEFISSLNSNVVKHAAIFSTYGKDPQSGEIIKKLLEDKNIHVIGSPFVCKGKSFGFINRNHPNQLDLQLAKEFAKDILSKF